MYILDYKIFDSLFCYVKIFLFFLCIYVRYNRIIYINKQNIKKSSEKISWKLLKTLNLLYLDQFIYLYICLIILSIYVLFMLCKIYIYIDR